MSPHDWSQYEESPGNGRSNWLVWKRLEDTWAIEMFVTATRHEDGTLEPNPPVVALVNYGPRGGTREIARGTIQELQEEIQTLLELVVAAREIEALR